MTPVVFPTLVASTLQRRSPATASRSVVYCWCENEKEGLIERQGRFPFFFKSQMYFVLGSRLVEG